MRFIKIYFFILSFLLGVAWANEATETKVQAAFLFQFTRFIDWPELGADFNIGVVENGALAKTLEEVTHEKQVQNSKMHVISLTIDTVQSRSNELNMVVFPQGNGLKLQEAVLKLKKNQCLAVSYGEGMAKKGSSINFYREGEHMRFEINPETAKEHGLQIHSQLLKLARLIE